MLETVNYIEVPESWSIEEVFLSFAEAHIRSRDVDPAYDLLRALFELRGYDEPTRWWYVLLYVTFYHLGSTELAFQRFPRLDYVPHLTMPTGVERRCFRGNVKASEFVNRVVAEVKRHGSFRDWFSAHSQLLKPQEPTPWQWNDSAPGDLAGQYGWAAVRSAIESVPYGGSWSSYKFADLARHAVGLDITASDIGVGGGGRNAGPVPGLSKLLDVPWKRAATDLDLQWETYDRLRREVAFDGIEEFETCLCDFNSMLKGGYYVGHDIDTQMEHLADCPIDFWEARLQTFNHRYLGECRGWHGVRKPLNRAFHDHRILVV